MTAHVDRDPNNKTEQEEESEHDQRTLGSADSLDLQIGAVQALRVHIDWLEAFSALVAALSRVLSYAIIERILRFVRARLAQPKAEVKFEFAHLAWFAEGPRVPAKTLLLMGDACLSIGGKLKVALL